MHILSIFKSLVCHFLFGVIIFVIHNAYFLKVLIGFSLSDQQLRTNVSKCQSSLVFYLKHDSLISKIYII